jgi:GR25 family glycosyltransferase involved in LPS biosynthesis
MKDKLDNVTNLSYEFIFGKTFNKDFVCAIVNPQSQVWNLSEFSKDDTYIQRAYSCSEGHRRILENFLNQDEYDWALIMEDDLDIDENIMSQLDYLIDNNKNYNWFHLSTQAFYNYLNNYKIKYEVMPRVKLLKGCRSALAYMVNKKFALKYYKALCTIKAPNDITLWLMGESIPVVENINIFFSEDQKTSTISNKNGG